MKAILFIIIISTVILMQYAESQLHDIIDIPKNCNGKDFICTSKNEFLLCFDVNGTGETVTIDKISQSCPIGTICDNADTVECYRPDPELSTTKNTISILPPAPTPPKNSRNCNGKDFICLNKKEFLICFDVYGNGQTETIDDVTQSCPIGVICDNTGNFECSMPDPEAVSTDNSLIASISSQSSPVDPPTTPSIQATIAVQPTISSITPEQIHITLNQSKPTSTSSISVDPINIPTISNAVNSTPQVHQSTTGMDSILPTIETTSISMGNTTESIPILISILTTEASTLSSATDLTFGQTSIPATSSQPNIGDMSDVSSISSTTHSVVSQQNKTSITESPLITSTQTSISDNYIENLSVTGSSPGSTNNIDEPIKHSTEGFTAEQINVDVVTMDLATGIGDVPATSSTIFMEILSSENTHSVNELLSTTNISTTEPTYLNTEPNMISTQVKVSTSSIFTTDTIANGVTSIINTSGNLPGVQHLTDENSIFTTSTPPNTTNQTADLSDVQNLSSESSIITTNLPSDQYLASESSILTTSTTTNLLNQNTDVTQSDAQYLPSEITSPGTPTNNLLQHIDANPTHVQHLPTESSIIISRTSVNDTDIPVMENLPSETLFLGTSMDETSSTPMLNQHTINTLTHDPYLPSEITSPDTPTKNLLQHIDANPPHVQHLPSESSIIISSASVNDTDIPVMQNLPSETLFTATNTDETSSTPMLNQHSLPHDPYLPGESSIIAPSTPAIEATSFTNQHTDTTNILISENSIITTSTPNSEAKSLINHHIDRDLTIMQNSPSETPTSVASSHYSPSTSLLNQSTNVNPVDGQYAPSESLILITSRPDSESTSFINQHTDTDISVMQNLISESTILTTSSTVILEPLSFNQQIGTASNSAKTLISQNVDTSTPVITPPTSILNQYGNANLSDVQYLSTEGLIITTSTTAKDATMLINQHTDIPVIQNLPSETARTVQAQNLPSESSTIKTNTTVNETTSFTRQHTDIDTLVMQNLSSDSTVIVTSAFSSPSTSIINQNIDLSSANLILTTSIPASQATTFTNQHTDTGIPVMQNLSSEDGQTFDDINTITPVQETTRITHSDNLLISKNVSNLTEISTVLPSKNEIMVTAVPHHESVSPTPLARVSSAGETNAILVTEPISIVKTETTVPPLIINGDSTLGYSLESQQVTLHTTMKSSIDSTKTSVAPENKDIIEEALLPLTTQITSINKQNSINNINLTDNKTAEIEYQNSNSKLYDLLQGASVENYANNDPLIGAKSTVARFENVTSIHATLSDSSQEASLVNKLLTDQISVISKIEVINKDSDEQVGFSESSETSDESLENDATRLDSNEGENGVIEEGMPSSSNELLSVKEDSVQSKQHHASHVLEGTNMEDYNNREILFPITERPYKINQELKSSTMIIIEPGTAEHSPNFTIGTLAGYRTLPGIPHGKLYPGVAINMLSDISPFFDRVMVTEHINHDQPMLNLTNSDKSMLGLIIRTIDPIDRFEEEMTTYDLEFDKSMTRAKVLPLFDSVMASARVTRLQIETTSASTIISPKSVSIRVPITPPSILGTLLQTTSPNEVVSNLTLPCSTNESGTVSSSSEENIVKRDIKYSHVESKSPSNWTITNGLTNHNHTIIHKNRVPTPNVMSDPTWSSSINEATTDSSFNEEVAFKEDVMYSQVTVSKSTLDYTSATSKSTAYQSANLHTTHHMNSTKITKTLHSLETNKVSLSEFECTVPGSFKHPSTNRDYYVCLYTDIGLEKYHFVCPSDQIYNSTSQQCTKYQENELDASDTFKCVRNGRFKNENDIQKYYWCLREGPTELKKFILRCPNKSIFNSVMRTCIPADVSDNETIPIADDSNESKEHNLNDNRQKSRLKILKDVKKNEKDVLKSEIKRLEKLRKLNEKMRRNDSEESKLEDREEKKVNVVINRFNIELKRILMTIDQLKVTMDEIEEGRSGGDSRKNELKFKCMTIGRFPDPNDCTKYFTCTVKSENFSKQRLQCKTGFRFDSLSKFCVNANYAVCG